MIPREAADLILAVDVGGTALAGGLVDQDGAIITSQAVATDRFGRGEGILKNLLELVDSLPGLGICPSGMCCKSVPACRSWWTTM
jgi:predicted NBD/HSP70 family sugar kinase